MCYVWCTGVPSAARTVVGKFCPLIFYDSKLSVFVTVNTLVQSQDMRYLDESVCRLRSYFSDTRYVFLCGRMLVILCELYPQSSNVYRKGNYSEKATLCGSGRSAVSGGDVVNRGGNGRHDTAGSKAHLSTPTLALQ